METNNVWLVTGASKGIGLSLVKKLLASGHSVAATSRNVQSLINAIGAPAANFLPLEVNLADNNSVLTAVEKSIAQFGHLDVVVNNAGYGQIGTLEELSDMESRENFDVNVFGTLNVIRNVMPQLRKQQKGHIFNIASIGGYHGGFPGWGIYLATKFAVAGLTESLAAEIKEFGVNATVVYPGYFRTDFLSKGSVGRPEHPIEAYTAARKAEQAHINEINHQQPNDPDKAADVLIAISQEANPPVHLFLGKDAYDLVQDKQNIVNKDVEQYKNYTFSTAY